MKSCLEAADHAEIYVPHGCPEQNGAAAGIELDPATVGGGQFGASPSPAGSAGSPPVRAAGPGTPYLAAVSSTSGSSIAESLNR